MAKEFNVALNDLVDTFRDNTEPNFRQSVVSELRTLAEFINKSDPWPAEIKATEEAIKRGDRSISEPTEAEMKRAAADEEAAALARMRGVGDDYTSKGAPDVPEDAKEARLERNLKQERGVDDPDPIPGRPIPVPHADRHVGDATKPDKATADKLAAEQKAADKRAAEQQAAKRK